MFFRGTRKSIAELIGWIWVAIELARLVSPPKTMSDTP